MTEELEKKMERVLELGNLRDANLRGANLRPPIASDEEDTDQ